MKKQPITVRFSGYGHWKISMSYYGKEISCITTNSTAVDDYNSGEYDSQRRVNRGYSQLRSELIRKHKDTY